LLYRMPRFGGIKGRLLDPNFPLNPSKVTPKATSAAPCDILGE